MMTQTIDLNHFQQKARQVRERVPDVLSKWGLPPKFNRWRLTQDPDSGMVVLFAILNTRYIATHTTIRFSDYFNPRLLQYLESELHLQVVSWNSDGLRYAFILDRGQIDFAPTHIEFPFLDGDKLFIRVALGDYPSPEMLEQEITPAPIRILDLADDQVFIRRGAGAFLKVLDEIKLEDEIEALFHAQSFPKVETIDKEEFKINDWQSEAATEKLATPGEN